MSDFWYDEVLPALSGDSSTLDDDPAFNEAVGDALDQLDGSTASAVSLLTGLAPERLDELGGFARAEQVQPGGYVAHEVTEPPVEKTCPQCGGHVRRWYAASFDEGDVDPRAQCDDCEWGY